MKDEIKLKDMTDFLENVYKDIKKQPTLEEELEKERKFINKIKGDNEDEIKEIQERLDYLKAIEIEPEYCEDLITTGELQRLLDYITNLETIEQQYSAILSENAELENKITNLQEEYEKEHYLVDKLTRQLNDEYKNTEYQCKQKKDYKSRNEKAVSILKDLKYIDKYKFTWDREFNKALNILQGEDKDE